MIKANILLLHRCYCIDDVRKLGFDITWDIAKVGWIGPNNFQRQLSVEEINRFADMKIDEAMGSDLEYMAELSTSTDESVITENLNKICPKSTESAVMIWRVVLLQKTLSDLSKDAMNGLLELTEFWSNFGFPADSPHVVQGLGNDIPPNEYYTQENFEKLLQRHRKWLKQEIGRLLEKARYNKKK